jgi:hypothetical protein
MGAPHKIIWNAGKYDIMKAIFSALFYFKDTESVVASPDDVERGIRQRVYQFHVRTGHTV